MTVLLPVARDEGGLREIAGPRGTGCGIRRFDLFREGGELRAGAHSVFCQFRKRFRDQRLRNGVERHGFIELSPEKPVIGRLRGGEGGLCRDYRVMRCRERGFGGIEFVLHRHPFFKPRLGLLLMRSHRGFVLLRGAQQSFRLSDRHIVEGGLIADFVFCRLFDVGRGVRGRLTRFNEF